MSKTVKARGIDVSYSQGCVDWDKVKASGVDYAILRCGFGNDTAEQDDAQYARNADECERLGIPYGVYLYSYAQTVAEAKSEAAHVIRLLKGRKLTYPVYYDLEDEATTGKQSANRIGDIAEAFCESVIAAGYAVGIYASKHWFTNKLSDARFSRWPKWVAQYNDTCTYAGEYEMWQYTSAGKVAGIAGNVDCNVCYVDYMANKPDCSPEDKPVSKPESKPKPSPQSAKDKAPDVVYRVRCGGKWLPEVKNLTDFAGIAGVPVTDVAVKVTDGTVKYRVHVKGSGWLPYVTGCNIKDAVNGYAGNGKEIDAVEIYYFTPKGKTVRKAKYRVSPLKGGYWPWQYDDEKTGGQDGYAGAFGRSMDRLQIVIE